MSGTFEQQLRSIVGPKGWKGAEDQAPFLTEWRGDYQSVARAIVCPDSLESLRAVVSLCHSKRVPIVPQGGNTGLCGGAVSSDHEVIVSTQRMRRSPVVLAQDDAMLADAGNSLATLKHAADAADRLFPLSLSAEGSCQIGGNLSTNAGGVNFLRYGGARDQVLGLQVVLADGRVLDDLHVLRKNNAGYDWKHWFIGAEGTLGIITAASLKLWPKPKQRLVCWLAVPDLAEIISIFQQARQDFGNTMTAFELISQRALRFVDRHHASAKIPTHRDTPWYSLIELHGSEAEVNQSYFERFIGGLVDAGKISDAILAQSDAQADALWALRHSISDAQRCEGVSLKHDIALPLSRIAGFVDHVASALEKLCPGIRPVCFGHIGDGNLHYNVSQPTAMSREDFLTLHDNIHDVVHQAVRDCGGTISAEHGIGLKKRTLLREQIGEVAYDVMLAQKRALDPLNLMNPGKVL